MNVKRMFLCSLSENKGGSNVLADVKCLVPVVYLRKNIDINPRLV